MTSLYLGMLVDTTERMACTCLHKCSLVLQDFKCLLKTIDLSLAAGLALCVGLDLVSALLVKRLQVLIDCCELILDSRPLSGQFANLLVEISECLGLVLHVLLLGGLRHSCFLGIFLVSVCSHLLSSNHLSDGLGEIGLNDLKHADDATTSAIG